MNAAFASSRTPKAGDRAHCPASASGSAWSCPPPTARTESGSCLAGSRPSLRISLDVLHLLAELLDLSSQFKPLRGQAHVIGLGAKRARLPPQLLGQEIEPAPDRSPLVDQRPRGGDMGLEPVELFADVSLGREQNGLLVEAVLIEAA